MSREGCECEDTDDTKFSVLQREAWMFLVRTSRTSLKLTPTSASLPCRRTTIYYYISKIRTQLLKNSYVFIVLALLLSAGVARDLRLMRL